MSKAATKALIDANITANGTQAITGPILNNVLNTMVDDYGTQEELSQLAQKLYGGKTQLQVTRTGEFLYTNYAVGTTIDLTNFGTNPSFNCFIADIPEDASAIIVSGTGGSAGRLWAFLDQNNVLLSVADASITLSNESLQIPEGAKKVVVNTNTAADQFFVVGSNDIGQLDGRIDTMENEIDGLGMEVQQVNETIGNPSGELVLTADDYCGFIWNGSQVVSANSTINGFLVELTKGVNYTLNSRSFTRIIFSARPAVGTTSYVREVDYNFVAAEGENWLLITVNKTLDTHVPQSIDYTATGLYSVIENIGKEDTGVAWTSNTEANKHIAELYINPDYYVSGLKFKALIVKKDDCTISLYDSSDNLIANFSLSWSMPQSYPVMPYSELLFPIHRNSDYQLIGYIKFIYTGSDYAVSSVNYILDEEIVTDLNNSKTIKAVCENDSEGVLFGDSLISYPVTSRRILQAYLTNRYKMHFWDAGCGGCTMAYRTAQGTDYYDSFTFVKLADLFVTGVPDANQSNSHDGEYAMAVKNLLSIDKTKRLFIVNEYGLNDYNTGVILKGSEFVADEDAYDIDDLDKTTLLGAMSYGVARLFSYKPDIHYCQVTTPYVVYDGIGYGDMEKTGTKGLFSAWCDSICKNATKLGVPFVKGVNLETGRNFFNNRLANFNTVDGNHTNEYGAYCLAVALSYVFDSMM